MSFNLGFGRSFGGFNNFYDPFFNPYNNFNSFYGNGAFGGGFGSIYSFYRPGGFNGGFGNYGFGNNYFFDPIINNRPNNPRPRGSYDNVRSGGRAGDGNVNLPPNSRPVRPDGSGSYSPRTVDDTRNPSTGSSSVRPTRPTENTTSRPTQSTFPSSRPTRSESPSSLPPSRSNDSGSSSSPPPSRSSEGSSSGGGTSSPRPTRPGGN